MTKQNRQTSLLVAAMVFCAILLRVMAKSDLWSVPGGIARAIIYIALYIGWGISVSNRIIQVQVRHYLIAISGLMVFWFVFRTTKYHFTADVAIRRQLWYWYYLPMLLIPLFSLFVSVSLGKSANARLPKSTQVLYIPTVLCLLLVLTNDFHHLVFSFPEGEKRYGRMLIRSMKQDIILSSAGKLSVLSRHLSSCSSSAGSRKGKNICLFCC